MSSSTGRHEVITTEQRVFIDTLNLKDIHRRLSSYAYRRLQVKAQVGDLNALRDLSPQVANEAFARLYSPKSIAWESSPPTQSDLEVYLKRRINDIVSTVRKQRSSSALLSSYSDLDEHDQGTVSQENVVELREVESEWLSALIGDEEAQLLVLCFTNGNFDCAVQAQHLDVPMTKLRYLRRKVRSALERILAEKRGRI